jgi:hypothetical protein
MQYAQLYRRGVVLAKTPQALQDLLDADVSPNTPVDHMPISDELFLHLWRDKFFHDVNRVCHTLIDDYEEDFVPPDRLDAAERVVQEHLNAVSDKAMREFYERLAGLLAAARSRRYPVLFVL